MIKNTSPLRYPGGKTRARKILWEHIEENFDVDDIGAVVSPFFGGGSFEFYIQEKLGANIYANDLFTPLISFWDSAKTRQGELCAELRNYLNSGISKDDFAGYRDGIIGLEDKLIQGVYYFIINRCSFSGATLSGGFSEEAAKKRFTESSIARIEKMNLSGVDFTNVDFEEFLAGHLGKFIFADPPYFLGNKSTLYGKGGDLHKDFDHARLHKVLSAREGWVLTYNNCDYIRELYEDYYMIEVDWSYGMSKKLDGEPKELIIICPF